MNLFKRENAPAKETRETRMREWKNYFNEWFDEWPHLKTRGANLSFSPDINLKEDETEYVVEAGMPGMQKDDIDVSVKGSHLVMRGEKRTFDEESRKDYQHVERTYGSFYRTIPLASDADTESIRADFKNGVLEIHIGKLEEGQASNRKVEIREGQA